MVDQRILRGKQAHVRIGLLHDAKNGLGRIHADAPTLDDALLPLPRQGGESTVERDLELLLPGGRQQFVVGRDVVYECDVKPANSHALQAVLDRTAHAVRRVVEHNVVGRRRERKVRFGVVVRRGLEQLAHLRGQDVVVAVLIVEEVAVTPFPKPKPVPRRHVVISRVARRRTRLAFRSRASRMLNTPRTRSHSANLRMVPRTQALIMERRSTRASRSALTNDDSGTGLFLSSIVSSVATGFRNVPGTSSGAGWRCLQV